MNIYWRHILKEELIVDKKMDQILILDFYEIHFLLTIN